MDKVPLKVAKHPVGVDSINNALVKKLNLNSVEKVIKGGIWVLVVMAIPQLPRLCTIKFMVILTLLPLYLMSVPLL